MLFSLLRINKLSQLKVPVSIVAFHEFIQDHGSGSLPHDTLLVQKIAAPDGAGNPIAVIHRNPLLAGDNLLVCLVITGKTAHKTGFLIR